MTIPRFHVFTFRSPIRRPLSGLCVSNQLLPFSSVQINLLFPCNQYYQQSTSLWFLHRRPRSTIRPQRHDHASYRRWNGCWYSSSRTSSTKWNLIRCLCSCDNYSFSMLPWIDFSVWRRRRWWLYMQFSTKKPTNSQDKEGYMLHFLKSWTKIHPMRYRMMEAAHFFFTLHLLLLFPFKPNHLARPAGNN